MTAPVRYIVLDVNGVLSSTVFVDIAKARAHAAKLDRAYPNDVPHTVHPVGPAIPAPGSERWERVTRWAVRREDGGWWTGIGWNQAVRGRALYASRAVAVSNMVSSGSAIVPVHFRRRVKP